MYTDAFQSEVRSGETVLWTGQPEPKVVFHREDLYLIPFSLMWGGFAIFWEASVLGLTFSKGQSAPWFLVLWGVPFVVAGQYMIWGRFVHAAWKKRGTFYAITNKRVLIRRPSFSGSNVSSIDLRQMPLIEKSVRSDGIGTLSLSAASQGFFASSGRNWGAWTGDDGRPALRDIANADHVHQLLLSAVEEAGKQQEPVFGFNRLIMQ